MGLLSLALYMAVLQPNHLQRDWPNIISFSEFPPQETRHTEAMSHAQNTENEKKQFTDAVNVK
jgi:hypothetical protein